MRRTKTPTRLSLLGAAAIVGAATLLGGCVAAGPPARVVVRPPAVIAVHLARPGWDYVQIRGTWYYGPRGARRFRHDYYVWRGGAWVFVR